MKHKSRYIELDVLRGMAIAMMVINHYGYAFLTKPEQAIPVFKYLIFIGSFAPVLFFFVTGIGYGINSHKAIRSGYWLDAVFKALLLIMIERVAHIEAIAGMDFLGFIAFLILLLSAIRFFKIKISTLFILCVTLFAIRFLIGPVISSETFPGSIVKWLMGIQRLENFSYPLIPWVIYPLFGYILGEKLRSSGQTAKEYLDSRMNVLIISLLIFILALFSVAYVKSGFVLFRWGTMSLDYFILSLIIIIIFSWLSILVSKTSKAELIAMAGLTSLLVVPIHYYLLEMSWLNIHGNTLLRVVYLLLFSAFVFIIAKTISRVMINGQGIRYLKPALFLQSVILLAVLLLLSDNLHQFAYVSLVFALQISLSYFFLTRPSVHNNAVADSY